MALMLVDKVVVDGSGPSDTSLNLVHCESYMLEPGTRNPTHGSLTSDTPPGGQLKTGVPGPLREWIGMDAIHGSSACLQYKPSGVDFAGWSHSSLHL